MCCVFLPSNHSHYILIMLDNTMTVHYINKRSLVLCAEAILLLWDWCVAHVILLLTACLPGTQNVIADCLRRKFVTNHKWEFHDTVVNDFSTNRGFQPGISLPPIPTANASRTAPAGILALSSAGQTRGGLGLVIRWSDQINYAFFPTTAATVSPAQDQVGKSHSYPVLASPILVSALSLHATLMQHSSRIRHPDPHTLHLRAWFLMGICRRVGLFVSNTRHPQEAGKSPQGVPIRSSGSISSLGPGRGVLPLSTWTFPLC